MRAGSQFLIGSVSTLLASGFIAATPIPVHTTSGTAHVLEATHGSPPKHTSHTSSPEHGSTFHHKTEAQPDHQKDRKAEFDGDKHFAIFHTDGKFDDKFGVTFAERAKKYKRIHVVLNGIQNHEGAVHDWHDWNHKMDELSKKSGHNFHKSEKVYYRGGSPFMSNPTEAKADSMPHEKLFVKPTPEAGKVPNLHDLKDLHKHLEQYKDTDMKGHIYQSGPAPEAEVLGSAQAAKDHGVKITKVHHILGYNTRQDTESREKASEKTQGYATNLHKNMKAIHGHGIQTVMTNSYHNFKDTPGTTQDYHFIEGRVPDHHLDQVGKHDRFALEQFAKTDRTIKGKTGKEPHKYLGSDHSTTISDADMWRMRYNEPADDLVTMKLRKHNIQAAQNNRAMLESGSNTEHRMGSAINGLIYPCQAEACDANHIALVHLADERKRKGEAAYSPVHIGDNTRMNEAKEGQEVHGVSPLPHQDNKQHVTELLEHYFPQDPTHPAVRHGYAITAETVKLRNEEARKEKEALQKQAR